MTNRFSDASTPPGDFVDRVAAARRPVLLTHIYPDGDAIGSQLALARALASQGAEPRILIAHPAPLLQEFMDPEGVVVVASEEHAVEALATSDLCLILDTSDYARLGRLERAARESNVLKYCIDHHLCVDPTAFDALWSDPSCPATGLLVLSLLDTLGIRITAEIAEPLFIAVATDTGWFRFSNATALVFESASRLVSAGADPAYLHRALFENSSLGRTQMLGEMLSSLSSQAGGRLVYSVVRQTQLGRFGIPLEEIDGFIDHLKEVRGAEILILFVEVSSGRYKVSLRSKGRRDVHAMASQFGGGGHAKAAGFRIEGSHDDVVSRVVSAALEVLQ